MSERRLPDGVLAVRPLPGANCSSVGSVVDMLFVAGVVVSSVAVAVAALSSSSSDPEPAEEDEGAGEG